MKTVYEIMEEIRAGKAYSYPATFTKGRIYTITYTKRNDFCLSANNLKSKETLTLEQAFAIIRNLRETF